MEVAVWLSVIASTIPVLTEVLVNCQLTTRFLSPERPSRQVLSIWILGALDQDPCHGRCAPYPPGATVTTHDLGCGRLSLWGFQPLELAEVFPLLVSRPFHFFGLVVP